VLGLHGRVCDAIESDHGNHVLQKAIEVLPQKLSTFIIDELLGRACDVSQHRYGCRVVCRLIEHHCLVSPSKQMLDLVGEILEDTRRLCTHEFGHHVISHILQFGSQEHKHKVVSSLVLSLSTMVVDKRATRVIEDALKYCSIADRGAIVGGLFGCQLHSLAENEFGCYVVNALLDLPEQRAPVAAILRPSARSLSHSGAGRKVVQKLKDIGLLND